MYGGVAQTYCKWELLGDVYKKDDKLYIKVLNPKTNKEKEVRWYETAEAHKRMGHKENAEPWKTFRFDSKDDVIYLVPHEEPQPEGYWGGFGYWYGKGDKGIETTWPALIKIAQEYNLANGVTSGFWFNQEI